MNRAQRRKMGQKNTQLETIIGTREGNIVVEFPEKVKWISFPPAEARSFIAQLQEKIKLIEGEE